MTPAVYEDLVDFVRLRLTFSTRSRGTAAKPGQVRLAAGREPVTDPQADRQPERLEPPDLELELGPLPAQRLREVDGVDFWSFRYLGEERGRPWPVLSVVHPG